MTSSSAPDVSGVVVVVVVVVFLDIVLGVAGRCAFLLLLGVLSWVWDGRGFVTLLRVV